MKRMYGLMLILSWVIFSHSPLCAQTPDPELAGLPLSSQTQKCLTCHSDNQKNLFLSWKTGLHAKKGIGCFECHTAQASEPDAIEDHNGFSISPIVTPKDCARCHPVQAESFLQSYHAKSALILREGEKNDDYKGTNGDVFIGGVLQGQASFLNGCEACHGTKIKIDETTKRPVSSTYPNHGIGRINPDGTAGTCSACHQRHEFRMDAVRQAETCGRCHLGMDHPQLEIWKESKHGQAFDTTNSDLDLNQRPLILGRQKQLVPTCATCHVGATNSPEAQQTHDPGSRISWHTASDISSHTEGWQNKRLSMMTVCMKCHSPSFVKSHFVQYDKVIALYNKKFSLPAQELLKKLRDAQKLDPAPFNEKIERVWLSLWHHEGRRARMGAAMMGADYVQWQGFYEVANTFYFKFLPEAEKLLPGITTELLNKPEHKWLKDAASSPEQIKEIIRSGKLFWEETSPDPEPASEPKK